MLHWRRPEDVKRKWEAKKEYFSQYKKDGCRVKLLSLQLPDTLQCCQCQSLVARYTVSKSMHVDGRQKKECTVSRGRPCLISVIPNGTGLEIPYASSGSSTYECVGPLRTFHTFSPLVSPSKHLPCPCFLLLVLGVWVWLLLCRVFVSCFASVLESRILRAY